MALTMTRTRTQSALTKLVELVANINGELEFLEGLLAQEHGDEVRERLLARRTRLLVDKDGLFVTIRQFDPELEPDGIGASAGWVKQHGRMRLSAATLQKRYLKQLA